MLHELKVDPYYFQFVWDDKKLFEYRLNDRNFKEQDILFLWEYDREEKLYTGRVVVAETTFILPGGDRTPYPLPDHWLILAIKIILKNNCEPGIKNILCQN